MVKIEIKIKESHVIYGRGLVLTGTLEDNPLLTHNDLDMYKHRKQPIFVDGKYYEIRGIERFALPTTSMQTSDKFGLLVRPYDHDEEE